MLHVAQIPSDDCTAVEVRLVGERSGREPLGVQCFRSNGQRSTRLTAISRQSRPLPTGRAAWTTSCLPTRLDRNNLCSTDASQIRFQLA